MVLVANLREMVLNIPEIFPNIAGEGWPVCAEDFLQ